MDWDAVEKVLYNMHCRACDGYQCDHSDRVAEALSELKELAAQQSVHPTLLTRCPKCNAVTGWHHPLCEDYSPESQSG